MAIDLFGTHLQIIKYTEVKPELTISLLEQNQGPKRIIFYLQHNSGHLLFCLFVSLKAEYSQAYIRRLAAFPNLAIFRCQDCNSPNSVSMIRMLGVAVLIYLEGTRLGKAVLFQRKKTQYFQTCKKRNLNLVQFQKEKIKQ